MNSLHVSIEFPTFSL